MNPLPDRCHAERCAVARRTTGREQGVSQVASIKSQDPPGGDQRGEAHRIENHFELTIHGCRIPAYSCRRTTLVTIPDLSTGAPCRGTV